MKIMIFLGGFLPSINHGGPVISIKNMCELLGEDIKFYLVTKDHDLNSRVRFKNISDGWMKKDNYEIVYLSDRSFVQSKIRKLINDIEPDMVYINSLFSYSIVIPVLKSKGNIPTLIAPRGQLCKNAFKKKLKKMLYLIVYQKLFLNKNVHFQFTSIEEKNSIIKYLKVSKEKLVSLNNISLTPKTNRKLKRHKTPGYLKIVFISRIHPKKNLDYALNLMKKIDGKISFDIYGPIEDKKYWNKCKSIISSFSDNIICNYKGAIKHDDVFDIFSKYHLFLFPTKSENFGHVIPEALNMGCMVITSDQTPWIRRKNEEYLYSFPLTDIKKFYSTINYFIDMDEEKFDLISKDAIKFVGLKQNHQIIKKEYIKVFKEIVNYNGR